MFRKTSRETDMMICRIWRGWALQENARRYEEVVRQKVIPEIESRRLPGFLHIDLLRRDHGMEVEFQTIMWFENREAIIEFMGENYERSHVPEEARAVLSCFDERAAHYEVVERKAQPSARLT